MIRVLRPVRFEEVDAAGIVFFARFGAYAHEGMERLFDELEGGYVDLVTRRRLGFPAVKTVTEHHAPLAYGDVFAIEVTVARIGNRSADLAFRLVGQRDDVVSATMLHTVVITDLTRMRSCDMPPDVRAVLQAHLQAQ